ncbi:MAG: flavodoxin [Candidatus Aminicenantes bacterium]|nr:flavodoxin [Candidatus Aminicenantes bacterium]
MKFLVAYMTKTGNTKKIAEAIYGETVGEKELKPIEAVDSLDGYDVAFLGFPIHQMGPDKKTSKLLAKHCIKGRKVVLFITHAAPENAPDLQPMLAKFRGAAREADIIDMFDCQGELAKGIKRIMSLMPNAKFRMWAKMDNSQGQPDQARIDRARAFARDVMKKLGEAK